MSFVYRNPSPKKFKPSLEGYKTKNKELAKAKNVENAFLNAKTITEAKKILRKGGS